MRKTAVFFSFLVIICVLLTKQIALSKETISISSGEFPPYVSESLPNQGLYPPIIRKVFESAGIEVNFNIRPWSRAYEEVASGKVEASLPWLKTAEREKDLIYPVVPIEEINDILFFRKDVFPNGLEVSSLKELVNMKIKDKKNVERRIRIIGVSSYWYISALKELNADYELVAKPASAYNMIIADRADVHINTDKVGLLEIKEFLTPEKALLMGWSKTPVYKAPVYLAFSRKNPRSKELIKIWTKHAPAVLKKHLVDGVN